MRTAIRRILEITGALFLLGLLALFLPTIFNPVFVVHNNTREPVQVVAEWREQSKNIGQIDGMSAERFTVNDEAAMTFNISYVDGRQAVSDPIYFSNGLKVIATIEDDSVAVRYDHD